MPYGRDHADTVGSAVPALAAAVLGFFVITLDAVIFNTDHLADDLLRQPARWVVRYGDITRPLSAGLYNLDKERQLL